MSIPKIGDTVVVKKICHGGLPSYVMQHIINKVGVVTGFYCNGRRTTKISKDALIAVTGPDIKDICFHQEELVVIDEKNIKEKIDISNI